MDGFLLAEFAVAWLRSQSITGHIPEPQKFNLILQKSSENMAEHLPSSDNIKIYVDIPGRKFNNGTLLPHIVTSSERPEAGFSELAVIKVRLRARFLLNVSPAYRRT